MSLRKRLLRSALLAPIYLCLIQNVKSAPNVIMVLTDDLGYGDIYNLFQNTRDDGSGAGGIAGDGIINGTEQQFIFTPNIDRMAAEGARLLRHYTSAPVCAPARGSLLQGRDQGHANVRDNEFDKVISDNHTLGTVMKDAGYYTACVGKWGVGGTSAPFGGHPNDRGFDYFYGYLRHIHGHQHYPRNGGTVFEQKNSITTGLDHAYTTDLWTARVKDIVEDRATNHAETPFFIYLAFDAPHAQLQVPTQAYPAGSGTSGGLTWPLNTNSGVNDSYIHPDYMGLNDASARHATMVRRLDTAMGDILQTLRDLDIDEDTLVVFTSDNGTHNESGAGGTIAHNPRNFDSFADFEGIKRDCWEGGVRMPTFAWWPGTIGDNDATTPAFDSTRPSAFWDWMPTFADAAGVTPPAWSNGVSLLPELTGGPDQLDRGYLYFEYDRSGSTPSYTEFPNHGGERRDQMQAIFLDGDDGRRFKGIRTNVTDHAQDFQIYDVDLDHAEGNDLASSMPELQQRMKERVLQVRVDGDTSRPYLINELTEPVDEPTVPGLEFKAFTGSWDWVPETLYLTPAATGTADNLDLSKRTRDDDIALEFEGFISIPADGTYTFAMTTDAGVGDRSSGAILFLHDAHIIDDDFNHDGSAAIGNARLKAGLHPIRVLYKHATGDHSLNLQYSGPGIGMQPVPDAALFRAGPPPPEPIALPDSVSTTGTAPVTISALANDLDDGAPSALSLVSIGSASLGTATISGNDILYTADEDRFGIDTFPYTITDGATTAQSLVTVIVSAPAGATFLSSDFNNHGSTNGAAVFTGINWITDGVSTPPSTLVLSEGVVQTNGASQNRDRLAVARNIDLDGPWSTDIPFTANRNFTIDKATFDYQFINNAGNNQGNSHPGSGIVTISLLDESAGNVLTTVTLPALGDTNTAANSGTGIEADFPDFPLLSGTSYVLRFNVSSSVELGNNFALDNLSFNSSPVAPALSAFNVIPNSQSDSQELVLSFSSAFAGRITISDGTTDIATFTSSVDGQDSLDLTSFSLPAVSETTTFFLTATTAEDGSGIPATARVTVIVLDQILTNEDFGLDSNSGRIFLSAGGFVPGSRYQLFRSTDLVTFAPVGDAVTAVNTDSITFLDQDPFDSTSLPKAFYRVQLVE